MSNENKPSANSLLVDGSCPDCGCKTFFKGKGYSYAEEIKCSCCGSMFEFSMPDYVARLNLVDVNPTYWHGVVYFSYLLQQDRQLMKSNGIKKLTLREKIYRVLNTRLF